MLEPNSNSDGIDVDGTRKKDSMNFFAAHPAHKLGPDAQAIQADSCNTTLKPTSHKHS